MIQIQCKQSPGIIPLMQQKTLHRCILHIIAATTLASVCYNLNFEVANKSNTASKLNATVAGWLIADLLPESLHYAKLDWILRFILLMTATFYVAYISAKVYQFLFGPANYVHDISGKDLGYHAAPGKLRLAY